MNNYSIGIVVPVYKVRRDYLECCVSSLVNQTYNNIQIVLVDDASPDECGKWCDEIARWDERIKAVHHSVNKGLPGARNTGVDNLETEYVLFVDADDWIEEKTCELLNEAINRRKVDIYVYSGFIDNKESTEICEFIYEDNRSFSTAEERTCLESMYLLKPTKMYGENWFPIQSACCRMVAISLFKQKGLKFKEIRFAEDAIFHLESTELAERIVYLHYNLYHYRNTEGSMVNGYRPNSDKEQISFMDALWEFSEKYEKDAHFRNQMYYISFMSMQMCIWQKYYNKDNKISYLQRRKECQKLFASEPYKSTIKNISFGTLRRNQQIKYVLMRLKLYGTMVFVRDLNKKHRGEISQ